MPLRTAARRRAKLRPAPRMSVSRRAPAMDDDKEGRLIATPSPEPYESLMGYVLRLTEANGYPTTSYILAAMHGHWYRSSYGRLDAVPLERLANLSKKDAARLTMRPRTKPLAYVRVFGTDMPSYEVSLTRPKVCPRCLANSKCEAFWDLTQAVACPIHGVMLVDCCDQCGSKLSWTRSKVAACRCGADLRTTKTIDAAPQLCELMAVLRALVYRDDAIAQVPKSMRHLAHLGLRRFCKLLWVMCVALHQRQGGKTLPKARRHYVPQLARIAKGLSDWPSGFRRLLAEMYDVDVAGSGDQPTFRACFSWLFVRLVSHDHGSGRPYAFLEEEAYRYGARHWTRGAMVRGWGEDLPNGTVPRWGTASEACSILGIHPLTLKKMVKSGEVPFRIINQQRSQRSFVVDIEWARQQRFTRRPPISARQAAGVVGVSVATLKALRHLRVYEPKHRGACKSEWAGEDVDALVSKLRARIPKRYDKNERGGTAEACLVKFRANPLERATFYKDLLSSHNVVIGHQGRRFSARNILVDRCAAERLLERLRADERLVSTQIAAKRLKCSADVVKGLKRAHHLDLGLQCGREAISKESLVRFEERFEVLASVVKRLGGDVRRAYHRLPMKRFRHLAVKGIQVTTVFVDRRDIDTVESLIGNFGVKVATQRQGATEAARSGAKKSARTLASHTRAP